MYNNIFKRVEIKYLIATKQKKLLLKEINNYIEKDLYYESTICNIYYDNDNNELIINSLEKPPFKSKVRIRSYGVPSLKDEIFVEIKNKYNGVVEKRRVKMPLEEFYNYEKKRKIIKNNQIMKEIDYYFKYYKLKPAIFIAYDRVSYRGKFEEDLRITIDSNLRSRSNNLKLELGDKGEKYFDKEYYIMEIKTLNSMPIWLVKSLSKLKIYPTSCSKYGKIYEKNKSKGEFIYD